MASAELWIAFLLATVAYAAVPGPGTVYIAVQAIMRDSRAALWGALGLHIGGYGIVLASAAGLTILFNAVPAIYEGLKLAGAAYLVWLGVRMIVARPGDGADQQTRRERRPPATLSRGMLVEILNPTTVVFYVAFLPQFIIPAGALPVWLQFLVLGVLVNIIFSLCDLFAILFARQLRKGVTNNPIGRRITGWAGGSAMIALAFRLAADRG